MLIFFLFLAAASAVSLLLAAAISYEYSKATDRRSRLISRHGGDRNTLPSSPQLHIAVYAVGAVVLAISLLLFPILFW